MKPMKLGHINPVEFTVDRWICADEFVRPGSPELLAVLDLWADRFDGDVRRNGARALLLCASEVVAGSLAADWLRGAALRDHDASATSWRFGQDGTVAGFGLRSNQCARVLTSEGDSRDLLFVDLAAVLQWGSDRMLAGHLLPMMRALQAVPGLSEPNLLVAVVSGVQAGFAEAGRRLGVDPQRVSIAAKQLLAFGGPVLRAELRRGRTRR